MNLSDVDPIAIVLLVTHSLDELGVPYFVGGSMASALHGSYRATADADIVADLGLGDKLDGAYIGRWAKQLGVSDLWLEAETAAHS